MKTLLWSAMRMMRSVRAANAARRALGLLLVAASATALAAAPRVDERAWPVKPIRIIVPGGPGGVTDIRARWLAERLGPVLNQTVYVENISGAGGNIGTAQAAHSAADGYTLALIHQGTMTINPHLYSHPGYDPLTDLIPVTRVGVGPLLLAVNPALPVRSVAELIALARSRPGQLSFGSPGIGTPPHMAGELFRRVTGIEVTHIPYRSGGQAASDLLGGHISFTIEGLNVQLPFIRSGQMRALAVTGSNRLAILPDVPTMAEAGLAGYEFYGWVGIAVPAATPRPVVDQLYRAIAQVLASAEANAWLASYGLAPGGDAPDAFAADIRTEFAKWGRVIRDAGIKAE